MSARAFLLASHSSRAVAAILKRGATDRRICQPLRLLLSGLQGSSGSGSAGILTVRLHERRRHFPCTPLRLLAVISAHFPVLS